MGAAAAQVSGRPFQPGQSGNPGGMPKGARQMQALISMTHGPKVLTALQKLFEMGMDETMRQAISKKGEVIDVPSIEPRDRVAALQVFVTNVGRLGGIEAVARQVGEEKPEDGGELVERVVDGLLKKPETREMVKSRLELVKP